MSTRLCFAYQMEIRYSAPIRGNCYTLRVSPRSCAVQQVTTLTTRLEPGECWWQGTDPFGNVLLCGFDDSPLTRFRFRETGTVTTGLADSMPAERYEQLVKFRYGSELTAPGPQLKKFYADRLAPCLAGKSPLVQGRIIMHEVHEAIAYTKGRTGMDTTAEEAMALGAGVCQDESHVMIALCRLGGITARYVTGFLIGEGESHAWVEVLDDGRWFGLDPTNDIAAADKHIRIAVGRDARDCPMNRGIYYGAAAQEIHVSVKVWEQGKPAPGTNG